MTDLEITELCARAMGFGYEIYENEVWLPTMGGDRGEKYDPLNNESHVLSLFEDHCLSIINLHGSWAVHDNKKPRICTGTDLKRVICMYVANSQKEKNA